MKKINIAITAIALAFSATAMSAVNYSAGEQVWEAERNNTQRTCGIGISDGSPQRGRILAQNEQPNEGGSVQFGFKTNAQNITWKITEAKVTDNANQFSFSESFFSTEKSVTSLFASVNGTGYSELSWNDTRTPQALQTKQGTISLQPKINVPGEDFPLGTTKIQGKITVTCSN